MRQKGMVCQNLLFTSKLCCFIKFHGSLLGFTAHLVPCFSHTFCKFERNCLTSFEFIRKSMGPVFFWNSRYIIMIKIVLNFFFQIWKLFKTLKKSFWIFLIKKMKRMMSKTKKNNFFSHARIENTYFRKMSYTGWPKTKYPLLKGSWVEIFLLHAGYLLLGHKVFPVSNNLLYHYICHRQCCSLLNK